MDQTGYVQVIYTINKASTYHHTELEVCLLPELSKLVVLAFSVNWNKIHLLEWKSTTLIIFNSMVS